MTRRYVTVDAFPVIGPYSQAVVVDRTIYLSGFLGIDPATRVLVPGGIRAEIVQAITNLETVLAAAGGSLSSLVKVTLFLADMAEYAAVNEIYATRMTTPYPPRTAVAVQALPLGARVEIDVMATTC